MTDGEKPIRILQVVGGMNRGGVETWLMNVLRNIDRDRFQMDFLVHTQQSCVYDEEIRGLGSRVIHCPHPSRVCEYANRFWRILKDYGPYDIVHSHVYLFSGLTLSIARLGGVPFRIAHIYPQMDLEAQTFRRRVYAAISRKLIALNATRLLFDSVAALSAFCAGLPPIAASRSAVVYPVVDLARFSEPTAAGSVRQRLGLPTDVPILLYVARFVPHKNHRLLIDLVQVMNSGGIPVHLVLCGAEGSSLGEVQSAAMSVPNITIFVNVTDVAEIMAASDVFVFPSLHEGFGIVAIEAQAAGLPVVAAASPAIRETLAPEMRPLMFEPADLLAAVRNVRPLLQDAALRAYLGAKGREWVSRFNLSASLQQIESLYREEHV